MRLLFIGLSLSSSWGNGHATTYRSLLKGLAAIGHDVLFLEREQPWYASHRDLHEPDFCNLRFYSNLEELDRFTDAVALADAVVIGSYVPDGPAVISWVNHHRRHLLCFYDIDTPLTLANLAHGGNYLTRELIPLFDLYLSFSGGPVLQLLQQDYDAQRPRALYCSVDPDLYYPIGVNVRWDLGYLGTFGADRQETLARLLLEPACRLPEKRFVVAGPQYPTDIRWPANVDRIDHLPPAEHAAFYSSLRWALNVTRQDMVKTGFSPSVRLFEATSCGAPVLSDRWAGIEDAFTPGEDMLIVDNATQVVAALQMPEAQRAMLGVAGRQTTLRKHTGRKRAEELIRILLSAQH